VADLTLEQVSDVAGLNALQESWDEVWQASRDRSPFTTWQWASTWWQHFGRSDRLEILVARRAGQVVGIAPFLRARLGAGPMSHSMLVGVGQETADYGGMLLGGEPEATAELFLDRLSGELASGLTSVNLTRLRPDGDLQPLVERYLDDCSRRVRLVEAESDPYPYLDLGGIDDVPRLLKKLDTRNDVWRRGRRFAEHHDVEFVYDAAPDAANLAALFDLSGRRWDTKGTRMAGLFAGEPGRAFIAEVISAMRAKDGARLSMLRADGVAVGARLGFECGEHYLGYKECFDPAYSQFGPGQYLTSQVLHTLHERGLDRFDFLRGEGMHKSKWANGEQEVTYRTLHRAGRTGEVARRVMWHQMRLRLRRWTG